MLRTSCLLEALGRWCRRTDAGSNSAGSRYAEAVAGHQELDGKDGLNNNAYLEITGNGDVTDTYGRDDAVAEKQGTLGAIYGYSFRSAEGDDFGEGKDTIGSFSWSIGVGQGYWNRDDYGQSSKIAGSWYPVNHVAGNGPIQGTGDSLPYGKRTGNKLTSKTRRYGCIPGTAFHLETAVINLVNDNTLDTSWGRTSFRRAQAGSNDGLLDARFISHV